MKFFIPIFQVSIKVKVKKQTKKNYPAYVVIKNKNLFKLVLRQDHYTDAIIVHECVHLANLTLKSIHQQLDIDNDEVQAYLTEYIYEQIKKLL